MPRRVARASSSDNHAVISWIMLRFRPIAPKPVGGDATSGSVDQAERGNLIGRRTKRKYVRVRGRKNKQCAVKKKKKAESKKPPPPPPENSEVEDASPPEKEVVTLQLLPERSDHENCDGRKGEEEGEDNRNTEAGDEVNGQAAELESSWVVQTWIIVESVMDKFRGGGGGLGFPDLERDTCPGFVSDGANRVIWINEAYKKMVGGEKASVGLVVKEDQLPHGDVWGSFACRVRLVEQRREQDQKWNNINKIVACDVWRVAGFAGWFAWKLDVNTALSLSL